MLSLVDVHEFSYNDVIDILVIFAGYGIFFDALMNFSLWGIFKEKKVKWEKFKSCIAIGMIGTVVLMLFNYMFDSELTFFYLLFSVFFSLNDIAYKSIMSATSDNQNVHKFISALVKICANICMVATAFIFMNTPSTFSWLNLDSRVVICFIFAIIIAIIMGILQSITNFGIKGGENRFTKEGTDHQNNVSHTYRSIDMDTSTSENDRKYFEEENSYQKNANYDISEEKLKKAYT